LRREIDWRSPLLAGGLILLIFASFSQPAAAATSPAPVPGLTGSVPDSPAANVTTGNAGSPETIFVFYNQHCSDCQRALTFLRNFSSRHPGVDIRYYDVFNSPDNQTLFQRFNEQYNTPNSPVPAVFVGTYVVTGSENIEKALDGIVLGLEEVAITPTPTNPLPVQPMVEITLPLVVTAALVDGINPCAFAVLIFLLVTLLGIKTRRKVLVAGIAYIAAVFIFYFLSGLGLFAAVQVAGASWILQIVGAGVSIIAGLLMIADSIRPGTTPWLSIPSSGKGIIERVIRHATVPAAFVLGLVVGVFELPCTGGVYLAILSLLAGRMSISAGLPWLFVYNVIFILPLVVILLAIYFGISPDRLEEWRKGRRNLLRFATGVLMLALGIVIIALMTR
jgi:cytochrome c biogenesis protein CcdA